MFIDICISFAWGWHMCVTENVAPDMRQMFIKHTFSYISSIFLKAQPSRAIYIKHSKWMVFSAGKLCQSVVYSQIFQSHPWLFPSYWGRRLAFLTLLKLSHRSTLLYQEYLQMWTNKMSSKDSSPVHDISPNYKYDNYSRQSIHRNYLDTLYTTHQLCPRDISSLYFIWHW